MKQLGLAFAATAVLAAGGPEATAPPPQPTPEVCVNDVRTADNERLTLTAGTVGAQVCAATIRANKYWAEQGLSAVTDVSVVYLHKPTDTYPCNLNGESILVENNEDAAMYCPDNNVVIVSDASLLHSMRHGDGLTMQSAAIDRVVYHELGHAAQDAAGQEFFVQFSQLGAKTRNELQADCLAGHVAGAEDPFEVSPATIILSRSSHASMSHGTAMQREAAFVHGAAGKSCDYATLQANNLIPAPQVEVPSTSAQANYNEPR